MSAHIHCSPKALEKATSPCCEMQPEVVTELSMTTGNIPAMPDTIPGQIPASANSQRAVGTTETVFFDRAVLCVVADASSEAQTDMDDGRCSTGSLAVVGCPLTHTSPCLLGPAAAMRYFLTAFVYPSGPQLLREVIATLSAPSPKPNPPSSSTHKKKNRVSAILHPKP
ncbi:uncharacterized [Tachysurus ichikawai]